MALALLKTWSRSWYSGATSGMLVKGWKVERMLASGSGNDRKDPTYGWPWSPSDDDEAQITLNKGLNRGV